MGGKVLICLLCLLTFNKTLAKAVNSAVGVIDNVSAESVPRLYSDRSVGVYASATPYAAYSFHVPTLISPKSNVVPVKEENVVVQNVNGYLKDSYGQRFVQAPQTLAYKSTFPQQFVQLQNLPAHLSQPLVAAAPNLHYTQGTPHFFGQSFTRFPNLQAFSPTPINNLASPQRFIYANNLRNLSPSPAINIQGHPTSQHQATINNNVYANTQSEPKLQRIQEEPKVSATNDLKNQQTEKQQITQRNSLQLVQALKENPTGKKTVVSLTTNPSVPLLDLTLLEPLRFANPIIPQVQHYLPRINNVKYEKLPELEMVKKHQMEFIVQNTKSYDSDLSKSKAKKESPKKKQKKHPTQSIAKDEEEIHETPTVTIHDNPNEGPELSYEINSPNYKETYTEKKISYNKQTQSEPVHITYDEQNQMKPKHYTYEKRTEMKPINYNYVHNSKHPVQDNREYHSIPEEAPKQHVKNIQSEEKRQQPPHASLPPNESEDSGESYDANTEQNHNHEHHENHGNGNADENGNSHNSYERPHHQKVYYHHSDDDTPPAFNSNYPQPSHKGYSHSQNKQQHFQPIVPEYEEDITIIPTHKPHASSNANRNHHRHHQYNEHHNRHSTPQNDDEQHHDDPNSYYSSAPIIVGKPKRAKEESPDHNEELMADMVLKQKENEKVFEKAYKDAAYGFPAHDTTSYDVEKHIYNPESYGASQYYKEYDIGESPLRQYEADGDDFPKFTRSQYKDIRDKTNDEYFDRYVASRPESIAERNNKKEEYYQTFANQRPEHYFGNEQSDKNQKAKYTAAPSFIFNTKPQRTHIHPKYQAVPHLEKYDYSKQAPHDNSPHATQTFQRYKSKTHFVEPQYQYGFEPLSLPHLLDSEMDVMASILSPKKTKPGMKKKEFKDNNSWVFKRTVTKAAKASS